MIHSCPHCDRILPAKLIKRIRKRTRKLISGIAQAKKKRLLTLENAYKLINDDRRARRGMAGGGMVWKEHREKSGKRCRCRDCQVARGWTDEDLAKWDQFEAAVAARRRADWAEKDRVKQEKLAARERKKLETVERRKLEAQAKAEAGKKARAKQQAIEAARTKAAIEARKARYRELRELRELRNISLTRKCSSL